MWQNIIFNLHKFKIHNMNYSKMSYEEILFQTGLFINNSLSDTKVKNAVAPMGYPEEKLNEGEALHSEATTLYETQKKEYGEVDAAQAQYETMRKNVHSNYMDSLNIARIAFKTDVSAITTLELSGRRASTISGWLKQTQGFYRSILLNERWKTKMAVYGQTEDKLNEELTAVAEVAKAVEAVKKEQGDAQNATYERDIKFEELIEWMSDYEVIARIALADKPQLLEKLGIVVKS